MMSYLFDMVLAGLSLYFLWSKLTGRARLFTWPSFVFSVVVLVYTVTTSVTRVNPGERAVVRRFGRVLPETRGPGLYVGLPWGIDRVTLINVSEVRQVRVGYTGKDDDSNVPAGQLLTGDHNLVNVEAEIQFRVRENEVEQYFLNADRAATLVGRAAESVLAEWVAARPIDRVMLAGKAELPRIMRQLVQQRIDPYGVGVQIEVVSIPKLNPPEEVKPDFDGVGKAQTAMNTQKLDAEQRATGRLRQADSESNQIVAVARTYAQDQTKNALGEVEDYNRRRAQFQRFVKDNPNYLNTVWLDEMTRLFAAMKESGRIDLLDHHLSGEGLNITQFPLTPKK